MPVRQSGTRQVLLLPVEINGIPATFLLDTATTHTAISREFADGNGMSGTLLERNLLMEAMATVAIQNREYVNLKSFRVGSIRPKRNPGQALIVDLPHLSAQCGEEVAGILGNATWDSADYVLDARRPSLGISRHLRLPASPEAGRLRVANDRTYLPVEINGRIFEFLLATGENATRVTQAVIDELKPYNSDSIQVKITTAGSTEYRSFPALHAEVRLDQVRIPQFTFLVGKENVIGLNLLRFGELSVATREGRFIFRHREGT